MSVVKTILNTCWKAVAGPSPEGFAAQQKPNSLVSFIKVSPGSLGEAVRPVWGINVTAAKESGIAEEGIPCRVGIGFEPARLMPDRIVYTDRFAEKSQGRPWQPL